MGHSEMKFGDKNSENGCYPFRNIEADSELEQLIRSTDESLFGYEDVAYRLLFVGSPRQNGLPLWRQGSGGSGGAGDWNRLCGCGAVLILGIFQSRSCKRFPSIMNIIHYYLLSSNEDCLDLVISKIS